jgi:hypothetical protein
MARPSKIHAQHTRSRPGLRIYTLSHLEFFISRKRKKENTRTLYGFSFGHSQSLYTAVIFFSPFDVCIRMDVVIFASVKTPPAPSRLLRIFRDFRNIARSIRVLLLSLLSMGHAQRKRSVPSSWFPHWAGQGRPPNKSFRCVCVYQLVTSIRFLFLEWGGLRCCGL